MKFKPKEILVTTENIIEFNDTSRRYFRVMNQMFNSESLVFNIIDSENNNYNLILSARKGLAKLINMKNCKIIFEQAIVDVNEYVSGETQYILRPYTYSKHKGWGYVCK